MYFFKLNYKCSITRGHYLTNKSADGIILLSDAADLASEIFLQRWSQCSKVSLCQRLVDLTGDL